MKRQVAEDISRGVSFVLGDVEYALQGDLMQQSTVRGTQVKMLWAQTWKNTRRYPEKGGEVEPISSVYLRWPRERHKKYQNTRNTGP